MAIFKTRKQREAEEAAAAAAAQKKRGIKEKISHIKVSDAIAGVGAAAAGVGAVFTTVGIVKSTCEKPQETPEEASADKILQWLLDTPGLKPNSNVWDLAWNSKFLKGARWDKRTTVCKMVETRWPEMSAAQQEFIRKHTLDESMKCANNNGHRKSGRK